MAAPSISAAVADIISLMKAYNKPYTPAIIEKIIKNSAQNDFQNIVLTQVRVLHLKS
ncbi:MAG: hypothetical protein K2X04_12305 [Burkholderiales bacterium]|nr:hypothetical protein [Burkholderiales bacterium]